MFDNKKNLEEIKKNIPYYEILHLFKKNQFEKYVSTNVSKFKSLTSIKKKINKKFENPFLFESHYDIPFHVIQNYNFLKKYKYFFFRSKF